MGRMIDKIKQQEQMTPPEILAGLIWDKAVNSKDRIFKVPYYTEPCYIEYVHDDPGGAYSLDVYYLHQEHSFSLLKPSYKQVLAIAPSILEWLQSTYVSCNPIEPNKPQKGRGTGRQRVMPGPGPQQARNNRQIMGAVQNAVNQRIAKLSNTPRAHNKAK